MDEREELLVGMMIAMKKATEGERLREGVLEKGERETTIFLRGNVFYISKRRTSEKAER